MAQKDWKKKEEPSIYNELREIFPNGDEERYKHYLRMNKGNVEDALYSYGLWRWEFPKYKKEIRKLKIKSKIWWTWYKKQ